MPLKQLALSLFASAAVLVSSACAGSSTAPTQYGAFSSIDIVVGAGTSVTLGDTVSVNYTGWLYDESKTEKKGAQFDTSAVRGPFTFKLGNNEVIRGWDQGVSGMKVGGSRRLVIPPSLGYGDSRNGVIPPNATLVFDIDLLDIVTQ